jgi:4-amino-4-deoxychorismate lyase
MPSQSPVPERQHRGLGLIETMLWTRERGMPLLPLHLARLERSAAALGLALAVDEVRRQIATAVGRPGEDRLRLRLVLKPDGVAELAVSPEAAIPDGVIWTVAVAAIRLDPADPLIRHKTTARQHYDAARSAARDAGADEALFLNGADEVCEGAITSVFVRRGNILLTPPLDCGLLPGVLRESLLACGMAREERLALNDLADGFHVGNAVRGLIPARLLEPR